MNKGKGKAKVWKIASSNSSQGSVTGPLRKHPERDYEAEIEAKNRELLLKDREISNWQQAYWEHVQRHQDYVAWAHKELYDLTRKYHDRLAEFRDQAIQDRLFIGHIVRGVREQYEESMKKISEKIRDTEWMAQGYINASFGDIPRSTEMAGTFQEYFGEPRLDLGDEIIRQLGLPPGIPALGVQPNPIPPAPVVEDEEEEPEEDPNTIPN